MKPSHNDIQLIRDKDKHDVADILRSDSVSIHNAYYMLCRNDGREHPYVIQVATVRESRFYQLDEDGFEIILNNFDVKNKVFE
jgi:hypothetical protein